MDTPSPASLLSQTELDQALVRAFGAHVYTIGGRVRDAYIGHFHGTPAGSKDHDYVLIGIRFEEAKEKLEAIGRVDLVGESFGVFKLDGHDVALARTERSTGWGHRDVATTFTPDVTIEEDALRRDITINTLSVRLSDMTLIAPIPDALDHIQRKTIDVISEQTFKDDPLRMLRCVQFASRFGFTLTERTRTMIRADAEHIVHIPAERIKEELDKLLLRSPEPSLGMRLLRGVGLTQHVIPELVEGVNHAQNVFHQHTVEDHLFHTLDASARAGGDLEDRWAALLHDVGKPRTANLREDGQGYTFYNHERIGAAMTTTILQRLRYSDDLVRRVSMLVENHMYPIHAEHDRDLPDRTLRRFIRNTTDNGRDMDLVEKQFHLRDADINGSGRPERQSVDLEERFKTRVRNEIEHEPAISVKDLHIKGTDVIREMIALGFQPATYRGDRRVREHLSVLLESVLDTPALNSPELLVGRLRSNIKRELEGAVQDVLGKTQTAFEQRSLQGRFEPLDVGQHRTGSVVAVNDIAFTVDLGGGVYTCALTAQAGLAPQPNQRILLEREGQDRWHATLVERPRTVERQIA